MIKNMTIEQLLNTDVIEEVGEGVHLLIKKMNELNENPKVKYCLTKVTDKGKMPLPPIDLD